MCCAAHFGVLCILPLLFLSSNSCVMFSMFAVLDGAEKDQKQETNIFVFGEEF